MSEKMGVEATGYQRIRAHREGIVKAPVDAVWNLLLDWGGIMKWWPKDNPPAPIVAAPLADGETEDDLPRSRIVTLDRSTLPPDIAAAIPERAWERLLHSDPLARTILYRLQDDVMLGIRNYFATTEVDAIAPNQTRIVCDSRFDVPQGVPAEAAAALIENIYADGIIKGFRQVLER